MLVLSENRVSQKPSRLLISSYHFPTSENETPSASHAHGGFLNKTGGLPFRPPMSCVTPQPKGHHPKWDRVDGCEIGDFTKPRKDFSPATKEYYVFSWVYNGIIWNHMEYQGLYQVTPLTVKCFLKGEEKNHQRPSIDLRIKKVCSYHFFLVTLWQR